MSAAAAITYRYAVTLVRTAAGAYETEDGRFRIRRVGPHTWHVFPRGGDVPLGFGRAFEFMTLYSAANALGKRLETMRAAA